MIILATRPTTPQQVLRRGLALVLDDTFIRGVPHEKVDFNRLVERLAMVAEIHAKSLDKTTAP